MMNNQCSTVQHYITIINVQYQCSLSWWITIINQRLILIQHYQWIILDRCQSTTINHDFSVVCVIVVPWWWWTMISHWLIVNNDQPLSSTTTNHYQLLPTTIINHDQSVIRTGRWLSLYPQLCCSVASPECVKRRAIGWKMVETIATMVKHSW